MPNLSALKLLFVDYMFVTVGDRSHAPIPVIACGPWRGFRFGSRYQRKLSAQPWYDTLEPCATRGDQPRTRVFSHSSYFHRLENGTLSYRFLPLHHCSPVFLRRSRPTIRKPSIWVLVAPLFKVSLLDFAIWRVLRAVRVLLQPMFDNAIVGKALVAGIPLGLACPADEIVKAAAHTHLAVPNFVGKVVHGHGRVIGITHQILPQRVKAVVYMVWRDCPLFSLQRVHVRAPNHFLCVFVSFCKGQVHIHFTEGL